MKVTSANKITAVILCQKPIMFTAVILCQKPIMCQIFNSDLCQARILCPCLPQLFRVGPFAVVSSCAQESIYFLSNEICHKNELLFNLICNISLLYVMRRDLACIFTENSTYVPC